MPADARFRPLRVLHCPSAVGGHPPALARAERALGLDSRCITVEPPPYGYEVDAVIGDRGRLRRELGRWQVLLRALRGVDVVHFNFGSTLLPRSVPGRGHAVFDTYARLVELRDLPLLRRAGRRIFVTFQGDDVRPTGAARGLARTPEQIAADERKAHAVRMFDRYAHGIYALNPDLLDYLPARARFLPYASVDLAAWQPVDAGPPEPTPVVVHAPTDPELKGTAALLAAVDRLRADGVELELRLVEGVSREAAQAAFARADLVVDQLLTGWYGGVSVEAMALGKPVVANVRTDWLERVPARMWAELPILHATTATVERVLREWLTVRREGLRRHGSQGRAFVERWHDPLKIAETVVEDYRRSLS
jgi:hypothetical protein